MRVFQYVCDTDRYKHIDMEDRYWRVFERFQKESFVDQWQEVPVFIAGGSRCKMPDLFRESERVPIFSRNALDVLGDAIPADVERLPLKCEGVELYALNVLNPTTSLRINESQVLLFDSGGLMDIKWGVFQEHEIHGRGLFTIKGYLSVFMTEPFYQKIKEAKLTGLLEREVGETV